MEIIIASVIFFLVGIAIGSLLSRSKNSVGNSLVPQLEERVRLLGEQKDSLETQVRSQESLIQALEPLREQVKDLRDAAQKAKDEQGRDAENIKQQLRSLSEVNEAVKKSTQQLSTALTKNTERGRWGEVQLEQILQASGLLPNVNFVMQKTFTVEGKDIKPDCVVFFPDSSNIVIDSKVPFDKFEASLATQDEAERKRLLKEHAASVMKHAKDLVDKKYHEVSNGFEFVILFMPFPSLLEAAIEGNNAIMSDLEKLKIIPATPTNLVALLNMIHLTWRRNDLANNIVEISELARVHLNSLNGMFEAVRKLGSSLTTSVTAFNDVASRLDNSVLKSATDLRKFGADVNQALPPAVDRVEKSVREIESSGETTDIQEIEPAKDE
jgi:DNA recombination protein RmuC